MIEILFPRTLVEVPGVVAVLEEEVLALEADLVALEVEALEVEAQVVVGNLGHQNRKSIKGWF